MPTIEGGRVYAHHTDDSEQTQCHQQAFLVDKATDRRPGAGKIPILVSEMQTTRREI